MTYTIGCFNRPWADISFDAALNGAAAAGFEGLGLMRQRLDDGELHHLLTADSSRQDAEALGARIRALGLKPLVGFGKPSPELVDRVADAGFPYLLVAGGYSDDLVGAVRRAEERDVIVVVKPHKGPCPTGIECMEVARRIDSPSFGIGYDPGNVMNAGGKNPLDEIEEVAPWVKAVCVKDFKGDTQFITPGDGDVDFESIFQVLARHDFNGPIVVETLYKGDAEKVNAEAKRARDYLAELLARIGA
jgi:sugar phosphate isomerase/epimerase